MNNIFVWIILCAVSLILGILSYVAAYRRGVGDIKNHPKIFRFFEIYRHFVGYFFSAVIGYYFIKVRWPYIHQTAVLSLGDFILGIAFLFGVLGWWPYLIKNITEGVEAIINKRLGK
ncbi:MAG: hypothetical protein WCT08_06410 [Patescibacteria group bacterium]|jgi:hypothetical protein